MRFGICINGDTSLIAKAKEYGYDYVEIALYDFSQLRKKGLRLSS